MNGIEPTTTTGKQLLDDLSWLEPKLDDLDPVAVWRSCRRTALQQVESALANIEVEARKQGGCFCTPPFPIAPDGDYTRARHDVHCRANGAVAATLVRIVERVQKLHVNEAFGGIEMDDVLDVIADVQGGV